MRRMRPTSETVLAASRRRIVMSTEQMPLFSLIGGAIFSAGAGGSTGLAPAFCASGSGRAGSGAGVVGRVPPGFDSAGCAGSLEGEPCGVGVACASSCGERARSSNSERPHIRRPAATRVAASNQSRLAPFRCSADIFRPRASVREDNERCRPLFRPGTAKAKAQAGPRRRPRRRMPAASPWRSRRVMRPARCRCGAPGFPRRPRAAP